MVIKSLEDSYRSAIPFIQIMFLSIQLYIVEFYRYYIFYIFIDIMKICSFGIICEPQYCNDCPQIQSLK